MGSNADVLDAIAGVLEAGARRSRQWSLNTSRQQDADVLEAMAAEARDRARMMSEEES